MDRKGLFQELVIEIPESLEAYELSKSQAESLYLDPEQFLEIITYYISKKQYDKAKETAAYAKRIHADNTQIQIGEANIYLELDELKQAEKIINQIGQQEDYQVILLRADLALREENISKAEVILEAFKEELSIEKINDIVSLYINYERYEQASYWLQKGEEKYSDDEDFILITADYYLASMQFSQAQYVFNKLLNIDPFSAYYWWGLAYACYELNYFIATLDACEMGLAADDKFVDLVILEGQVFQQSHLHKQAISYFKRALKLNCPDTEMMDILITHSEAILEHDTSKFIDNGFKLFFTGPLSPKGSKNLTSKEEYEAYEQSKKTLQSIFPVKEPDKCPKTYEVQDIKYFYEQLEYIEEEMDFQDVEDSNQDIDVNSPHEQLRNVLVYKYEKLAVKAFDSDDIYYAENLVNSINNLVGCDKHFNVLANLFCYMGKYKKALEFFKLLYDSHPESELISVKLACMISFFLPSTKRDVLYKKIEEKAKTIVDIDDPTALINFLSPHQNEETFTRIVQLYFSNKYL